MTGKKSNIGVFFFFILTISLSSIIILGTVFLVFGYFTPYLISYLPELKDLALPKTYADLGSSIAIATALLSTLTTVLALWAIVSQRKSSNEVLEAQRETLEAQGKALEIQGKTLESQNQALNIQYRTLNSQKEILSIQNLSAYCQNILTTLSNLSQAYSSEYEMLKQSIEDVINENGLNSEIINKLENITTGDEDLDKLYKKVQNFVRKRRKIRKAIPNINFAIRCVVQITGTKNNIMEQASDIQKIVKKLNEILSETFKDDFLIYTLDD